MSSTPCAPQTTQNAMRHSGASLRPQRRPRNATHQTTPHPTRAAPRSATRRATVSSISQYLRHRSAVAQRVQHRSISSAAVSPAPGISNIAVYQTSRYLGRPGISNIAVFPRFRIEIFGKPGPWRPWRLDCLLQWNFNGNLPQTWPGAAPGGGGAFSIRFLYDILFKVGPGRLRRPGGRFLMDFQ